MPKAAQWGRETLPHAPVNRQDGSRNREVLKRDFMFEKQQPGSPETGHPVHSFPKRESACQAIENGGHHRQEKLFKTGVLLWYKFLYTNKKGCPK